MTHTPHAHPRFAELVAALMSSLHACERNGRELDSYRAQAERVIGDLLNPAIGITPFVMSHINPNRLLMLPALLYSTLDVDNALSMDTPQIIAALEEERARLFDPSRPRPPLVCPVCESPLQLVRTFSQTWSVDPRTGNLTTADPIFVDESELRCSGYGFEHENAVRQINMARIADPLRPVLLCPVDARPLEATGAIGLFHADGVWDAQMARYRCTGPTDHNHLVFVADAPTTARIDALEEATAIDA